MSCYDSGLRAPSVVASACKRPTRHSLPSAKTLEAVLRRWPCRTMDHLVAVELLVLFIPEQTSGSGNFGAGGLALRHSCAQGSSCWNTRLLAGFKNSHTETNTMWGCLNPLKNVARTFAAFHLRTLVLVR